MNWRSAFDLCDVQQATAVGRSPSRTRSRRPYMFVGAVFPCTSINKIKHFVHLLLKWASVVLLHANTNSVPFFLWGTDKQSFFPVICYYILYSQRKKQAKDYEKKCCHGPAIHCCTSKTQSYKSTYQDRATRSWDRHSYYSTGCQREHSLQSKELHLKFQNKLREKTSVKLRS
jgi:hypothetical protein